MDKVLLYFALKYDGCWTKIYEALEKKEKITSEEIEAVESRIDCQYITVLNSLYPKTLKNTHKPPFVIFYEGDINLFTNYKKIISFVVDDWTDKYSMKQYKKLQKSLSEENKTFLVNKIKETNNADDISGQKTIAVVNGIRRSHNYGLVVSESYQKNEEQELFFNRLTFNLANALIVINADRNSQTMTFVNGAINDNKDIFVIPQCLESYRFANNFLIKQGAKLVEYPSDILNEI